MNELERIEAAAMEGAVLTAGGSAEHVGGALCLAHPELPITELNRALPLGETIDLDAIEDWYAGSVSGYAVSVTPDRSSLTAELEARGFRTGYAWMKFERGVEPAPDAGTELRVEETVDAEAFGLVSGEGFAIPMHLAPSFATLVDRPGWRCFLAWAGDEPAACGAVYLAGGAAWLGMGATRPSFRRRGGQNALLRARIEAARAAGATMLTTETGEQLEDRPSNSYRNILRAGFREAYLRPNWQSPPRKHG